MRIIQGEGEKMRLLTEARQIQAAAPLLFPMLERKRESTLQRLISTYRNGQTDLNAVAELSVIESLLAELKSKLQNLTIKEE